MTLGQRKVFLEMDHHHHLETTQRCTVYTWLKKIYVAILVVALLFVVALIALIHCRVMTDNGL